MQFFQHGWARIRTEITCAGTDESLALKCTADGVEVSVKEEQPVRMLRPEGGEAPAFTQSVHLPGVGSTVPGRDESRLFPTNASLSSEPIVATPISGIAQYFDEVSMHEADALGELVRVHCGGGLVTEEVIGFVPAMPDQQIVARSLGESVLFYADARPTGPLIRATPVPGYPNLSPQGYANCN